VAAKKAGEHPKAHVDRLVQNAVKETAGGVDPQKALRELLNKLKEKRERENREAGLDPEKALRERAKRFGYRMNRRGNTYNMTSLDPESDEHGDFGGTLDAVNGHLDVIEYKIPVQISSACGIPMFTINGADEKAGAS
jgi:hypothetical protein